MNGPASDRSRFLPARHRGAVLDSEHVGDIRGALGTIRLDDTAPRRGLSRKARTLLAIIGPGLIVMVGDNDAGVPPAQPGTGLARTAIYEIAPALVGAPVWSLWD
jgi:hypothetical protein